MIVPEWDPGARAGSVADLGPRTAWDTLVIDGTPLEAVAVVEAEAESRIDMKETPGMTGATLTNTGTAPGKVTIRLRCYTPLGVEQWAELRPQLQAKAREKKPKAAPIYHPALAAIGIDALVLASTTAPKSSGPGGYMEIVTKWIEFLPPRLTGVHTALGTERVTSAPPRADQFKKPDKPSVHGAPPPK